MTSTANDAGKKVGRSRRRDLTFSDADIYRIACRAGARQVTRKGTLSRMRRLALTYIYNLFKVATTATGVQRKSRVQSAAIVFAHQSLTGKGVTGWSDKHAKTAGTTFKWSSARHAPKKQAEPAATE